eukprot:COSAG01_NODE_4292_length_5167_cov_2.551500_5_plen_114_part_00
MAAVCTQHEHGGKCKHPCNPTPPNGSGPWHATTPPVNNLHRQYIEGVPGVWVQHPTTDPERDQMLAYQIATHDNDYDDDNDDDDDDEEEEEEEEDDADNDDIITLITTLLCMD